MSLTTKHILLAFGAGLLSYLILALTSIVPAQFEPFIAAAVTYFYHYYLENEPAGLPVIPPPVLPLVAAPTSVTASTAPTSAPAA